MIQIGKRERELPSEIIISELMILTNWLCAGFLQRQSIPLIYRNQPEPRETVPGAGKDNLLLNLRQRRLLNRVTLSTSAGNHSSLGLQPYSTFTSPIRKYADLVAQRQLKAALLGESSPYPEEELRKIITDLEINRGKNQPGAGTAPPLLADKTPGRKDRRHPERPGGQSRIQPLRPLPYRLPGGNKYSLSTLRHSGSRTIFSSTAGKS